MSPYEDEEAVIRSIRRRVFLIRAGIVLLILAAGVGIFFLFKLLTTVPEAPSLNTAPVVLWNFEEDDPADWPGTDEADAALRARGAEMIEAGTFSTPFASLYRAGGITWSAKTNTYLSSAENYGLSHGGDKALGVEIDVTDAVFGDMIYAHIWYTGGERVLRDVAQQQIAGVLGMWVHLPDSVCEGKQVTDFNMTITVYAGSSADDMAAVCLPLFIVSETQKSMDIPEDGWFFLVADIKPYEYVVLAPEAYARQNDASLLQISFRTTSADKLALCLDDFVLITNMVQYDHTAPAMDTPAYRTTNTSVELGKTAVSVNASSFALEASLREVVKSYAIWLDGEPLDGVTASAYLLTSRTVSLSRGAHHVRYEVTDSNGNKSTIDRDFHVTDASAASAVSLAGHTGTGIAPEAGSVYWIDLTAEYAEDVDSVTAVLRLNGANDWAPDYLEAADGFEASYELLPGQSGTIRVTIKRAGSKLTGAQTLVSLPVRVWSYDETAWVGSAAGEAPTRMTAAERFASSYGNPAVTVEAEVLYGSISYVYGKTGSFAGTHTAKTQMTGRNTDTLWHTHTAVPVEGKPCSCTTDGYVNRTWCTECASVADWGTRIPAMGHEFAVQSGRIVCTRSGCGAGFTGIWTDGLEYVNGTVPLDGWFGDKYFIHGTACTNVTEIDGIFYDFDEDGVSLGAYTGFLRDGGANYYVKNGVKATGWQEIDGELYYFLTENGEAVYGEYKDKTWGLPTAVVYEFDQNGKLLHGCWAPHGDSRRYYYGSGYVRADTSNEVRWITIDGETYGLNNLGYPYCGLVLIKDTANSTLNLHEFTDEGYYVGPRTDTAIIEYNGKLYLCIDGIASHRCLVEFNGDYYYQQSDLTIVTNDVHSIGAGILPAGKYAFGPDGKMLQGIVDGVYYVNGQGKNAGLIQEDGLWYLSGEDGRIACNTYVIITDDMAQDGVPAGRYWADQAGVIWVE